MVGRACGMWGVCVHVRSACMCIRACMFAHMCVHALCVGRGRIFGKYNLPKTCTERSGHRLAPSWGGLTEV